MCSVIDQWDVGDLVRELEQRRREGVNDFIIIITKKRNLGDS